LKRVATILCLISFALLAGCAHLDPWNEFKRMPASRSQSFEGDITVDEPADEKDTQSTVELSGRTLHLTECITIALEHNPRTAESWQAIRVAAARVGQAKAEYLPSIGFTSSARRSDIAELDTKADQTSGVSVPSLTGNTIDSDGSASSVAQSIASSVSKSIASRLAEAIVGTSEAQDDPGAQNRYEATFGARWLLFDGGGREARVEGAAAEVLAAGFRHNTAIQDVALEAVEAYYNLLAARSFRALAVETVRQRDYQLRLAQARHRAGVVAKSDVLRAQTEKADADLNLVRAKNVVHVAKGRLASTMGLRVSTDFQIADAPEVDHTQELADIEALLNEAARNRPELKTALAQLQFQRAGVRLAESWYWPALTVDTDFGWIGRSFPPNLRQWGVGLALDLPLFTGFDRNYQLHASKADLARAIAQREGVLRGVELEVWTAYWQTIEAGEAIEAAKRFVASAEESARVAEGEYKNGTGSIIGLIDAQTARTAAKVRLIQARLDWRTAMARFERAVGRSLAERGKLITEDGRK